MKPEAFQQKQRKKEKPQNQVQQDTEASQLQPEGEGDTMKAGDSYQCQTPPLETKVAKSEDFREMGKLSVLST